MRATLSLDNYQQVDVSLNVTMKYHEWKFVLDHMERLPGNENFYQLIRDSLEKLESTIEHQANYKTSLYGEIEEE
jgi:hypothetical protein